MRLRSHWKTDLCSWSFISGFRIDDLLSSELRAVAFVSASKSRELILRQQQHRAITVTPSSQAREHWEPSPGCITSPGPALDFLFCGTQVCERVLKAFSNYMQCNDSPHICISSQLSSSGRPLRTLPTLLPFCHHSVTHTCTQLCEESL